MLRLFKMVLVILPFSFATAAATVNNIVLVGSVVDNANCAASACLAIAMKEGTGATCSCATGTVVQTSVKNNLIDYRGGKVMVRFITRHYK